jgi:hypothetical protein
MQLRQEFFDDVTLFELLDVGAAGPAPISQLFPLGGEIG